MVAGKGDQAALRASRQAPCLILDTDHTMSIPAELKYTESHEWARLEAEGTVAVGITQHAQELLGDMVFVEPPEVGHKLAAGEECGVVESVKAASDIYAPIGGEVVSVNDEVVEAPEKINADPYRNWI